MTPFLLALMHKICYDDGKEMRGLMLEIRYKKIHKEKTKEATVTSLYIKNKEPLLIKGSSEDIAALFHCILKDAQVEFYLGSQNLDTSLVRTSIVHLNDRNRDYARVSVHEYLSRYVPNETLDTFLQRLELKDKQDCYLHEISSDDKLLIKAALAFFQQPYMLCIDGNWNLCGEVVQNKLHHMMCAYLQKGGYVILANTASCFYDCQEEYDLREELPQEKPMENFLDEDLSFTQRKVMPKFKKKHWYESRIIQVVKYSCYALLCFCISSIIVGWLLNCKGMQKIYQDEFDTYEEMQRFPIEVNAVLDSKQMYTSLNIASYEVLASRLTDVEWYPVEYFYINLSNNDNPIYLFHEDEVVTPVGKQDDRIMQGIVYKHEYDIANAIKENYEIPGIFISQEMARYLGAKENNLEGYSLHMTMYIPLYTSLSSDGKYRLGDLTKPCEVNVPIAGILSKNTNPYIYEGRDFFMSASLYDELHAQQQPNIAFYERDDMEELQAGEYVPIEGNVVPLIPKSVKIYTNSLQEASSLSTSLSTGSVQFDVANKALTLKNQITYCERTARLMQEASVTYILIAVIVLLVFSFLLRHRQRRHLEDTLEKYTSIRIWKQRLFIHMVLTVAMIAVSVWILYTNLITYERMVQLSTYVFTNASYDQMSIAMLLLSVCQYLLYLNELPVFYIVLIVMSTCISLCIFAPEYIKYLRLRHKQRIVTKKIS